MYYTGIGSRDIPAEVVSIMEDAGYRLAKMGWVLRSGKADGSDAAFQRGMQKYVIDSGISDYKRLAEIYIPWDNFTGGQGLRDHWDISLNQIDILFPEHSAMRKEWMSEVHPAPERLSQGAEKLHLRNVHQVFGPNLTDAFINQSKFVLYYAKEDKKGNPKGGTATAVNLAKKTGIRVLNLLNQEGRDKLESFLKQMEERRNAKSEGSPLR
ncbi:hypothetical protein KASHIRA_01500 [Serratia phage vB_SmaM-Kashira]|nr:hypothetical protein KASHIRA_01500 [Serratia phage vB_SmaM-Kashira]